MDADIYRLKLHECYQISEDLDCLRVPGGWIYREYKQEYGDCRIIEKSTFVPFDNEFKEVE